MKKTTFIIKNNNSNNSFCSTTKPANYSEILDNIILADIAKKNGYLTDYMNEDMELDNIINASKTKLIFIDNSSTLKNDKFIKAANFLANYKKNKKTISSKFIFGKTYKLSNGLNITFYDDEIQIGSNTYSYDEFGDTIFLNHLPSDIKKTIININIFLNK